MGEMSRSNEPYLSVSKRVFCVWCGSARAALFTCSVFISLYQVGWMNTAQL